MITNVKIRKKLDQIFRANRFIVAMEQFPFLMKRLLRNLVSRPLRAIALCILLCINLHEIYTPIYTWRERKISCFFFSNQEEKLSSPRQPIWWPTIYISSLQSSEKLEKSIFLIIKNFGKKERHSLTWKLARALVAHAHLYRILNKY